MTNIISTGISIDSRDAVKAKQDMEALAGTGAKVDAALAKVEQGGAKTGKSLATLSTYAKQASESSAQLVAQTQQLNATQSRQEILLKQIGSGFTTLAQEIKQATAASQAQGVAFERNKAGLASLQQAATGVGSIMAAAFTAKQVYDFADALFKASASAERIKTTLEFATGDSGKEFAYVTKLADQMGLQFADTARSYASFAAAAKGTALEGEGARQVFESVAKASAVMGLSSDQTSRALLALQQMMGKGTVQAEEIRGQLGEALPIAFQVAAKAMGVTTAEFSKMLERGEVVASDFLPKFARSMNEYIGNAAESAAQRLDASSNKMSNSWERLKTTIGDSGVSETMAKGMTSGAASFDAISRAMQTAKESGSGFVGQMSAAAGAYLDLMDPSTRVSLNMYDNAKAIKEAETRLAALQKRSNEGIEVVVQMSRLRDYIDTLKEAKRVADSIGASVIGAGRGSINPETAGQSAARLAASQAERNAYLSDNSRQTKAQIREEEYASAKKRNAALVATAEAEGKVNEVLRLQAALRVELANIDDKHKDKKPAAVKAYQDDAGTKYLQDLREQEAALYLRLAVGEKLTGAAKELAEFEQKIADFQGKSRLTKDQRDLAGRQGEIRAILQEMAMLEKLGQIEDEDAKKKAKRAQDAITFQDRAAQIQEQIETAQAARRDAYARTLGGFGKSDAEQQRIQEINGLYRESARLQDQLTKATPKSQLGSDGYLAEIASIKSSLATSLDDHFDYYKRLGEMQGNWSLGASSALATYAEDSANVARQMQQATGSAFKGMEDQLVGFVTTGKASFSSLINSVIADIVRLQVRQNITGPLAGYLNNMLGGGTTNIAGSALGNSFIKDVGMTRTGLVPMAKGGVFDSPSLSAYSSQVYDKPQLFAFAKGAGVFGEAGPEAIMPLRRGADGRLGVAASGGSGGIGSVTINNYGNAKVETKRTPDGQGGFNLEVLVDALGELVENRIADNIGSGIGPAPRAMEYRYGLRTITY